MPTIINIPSDRNSKTLYYNYTTTTTTTTITL